MKENTYRTKVCRELRKLGCLVIPLVGNKAGGSGWPDCMVFSKLIHFAIEFKGEETKIKPIQTKVLYTLQSKGFPAYVLRYPGRLQDPVGRDICKIRDGFALLRIVKDLEKK